MSKTFAFLFYLLSSISFSCDVNQDAFCKIERLAEDNVKVEVNTGKTDSFPLCRYWRWGAEGSCPDLAITEIKLSVNNSVVYIPPSAILDLGNPRSFILKKEGESFLLEIKGGDAATAYTAKIFFDKFFVRKRVVHSGEFFNDSKEVFIYSFPGFSL